MLLLSLQKFIKNNFYISLTILTIAGFLLRLLVSYQLANFNLGFNQVMMPTSVTDMAVYKNLAINIVSGNFSGVFYFQPFYYAMFLPLIKMTLGESIWWVILIQAIAGSLTIYLTGICGAMLCSRLAGFIAAILVAFSSALILYTPFLLIETLQVFWIILILYLCLNALFTRQWIYWGLAALICGCSILTRGNAWCFIPGILVIIFASVAHSGLCGINHRSSLSRYFWGLVIVAIFIILVFIPQLPFIYRNSIISGKLCGPSTASGAVLALGNTPEAPPGGRNPDLQSGPMEYPPTYTAWTNGAAIKSVPARIFEWATTEPMAYIELTFRKLLLFWNYQEIPNNISFVGEGRQSSIFQYLAVVPTGLIFAFGLAGTILFFRFFVNLKHRKLWLLFYFILSFWGATSAFYILCRFRLPAIPLLAICAGIIFHKFIMMRKYNIMHAYKIVFPPLLIAVFICYPAYDFYRNSFESTIMKIARPEGVHVELLQGTFMYLDNGPFTFGGWQPIEFSQGSTIEKRFPIPLELLNKLPEHELELTFASEEQGIATIIINNKRHELIFDKSGFITKKYKIPPLTQSGISITLENTNTKIYTYIDTQRNYSRSFFDGKNLDGEFVMRLYLNPKLPDKSLPSAKPVNVKIPDDMPQNADNIFLNNKIIWRG